MWKDIIENTYTKSFSGLQEVYKKQLILKERGSGYDSEIRLHL